MRERLISTWDFPEKRRYKNVKVKKEDGAKQRQNHLGIDD